MTLIFFTYFLKSCNFYTLFLSLLWYSYLHGVESFPPNTRAVHQRQLSARFFAGGGCSSPVVVPRFLAERARKKPCFFYRGDVPDVLGLPPSLVQQHGSVLYSTSRTVNVMTTSWKDGVMGYLNTNYHSDLLVTMAMAFTEIGTIAARKNAFSGGSYKVINATISHIVDGDDDSIHLDVYVQIRSEKTPSVTKVSFSLGKKA
jgi:hypothetical protein